MINLKTALLVAALVLAISYQHVSALHPPKSVECCEQYSTSPLRWRDLRSFYRTTDDCYLNAVVVVTKAGRKVCADPEKRWVKWAMSKLQERK